MLPTYKALYAGTWVHPGGPRALTLSGFLELRKFAGITLKEVTMKSKTARGISRAKKKAQKRVKSLLARFRRANGTQQVALHRELEKAHNTATKLARKELDYEVGKYSPTRKWAHGDGP